MASAAPLLYETVFKSYEIEYAVDANGRDRLLGGGLHLRLGVECDAKACGAQHREVVGAVAYGYGLRYVDVFHLGYYAQQLGFALAVDHIPNISARELSLIHI